MTMKVHPSVVLPTAGRGCRLRDDTDGCGDDDER